MPRQLRIALLVALAFAIVTPTAVALERGVVYSKTMERETPSGEDEFGPPVGGLYMLRGKRRHRVTDVPGDVEPSVSREGTIAFVRDGDIYVVQPDGTGSRQLTFGREIDRRPLFAPDGRSLLFTRQAAESDPRDLFLVRLDGTRPLALAAAPEDEAEAAFSLDGKAIVFVRKLPAAEAGVNGDLYSVGPSGTGLLRLTRTAEQEFGPRYFVGGIVFNRRRSHKNGPPDVFTMRRDGSGVRIAISMKGGATLGVVTPNGSTLIFRSGGSFWSKRVGKGGDPAARKLIGTYGADDLTVSPDGRKIAFHLYFDEQFGLAVVDLLNGELKTTEVHNVEGRPVQTHIDPRFAW